jgi:hypothetical protein
MIGEGVLDALLAQAARSAAFGPPERPADWDEWKDYDPPEFIHIYEMPSDAALSLIFRHALLAAFVF